MKLNETLRTALKETDTTQAKLAETAHTTQSAIANALKRNDIYVSTLVKWFNELGYDIIIQPRNGGTTMKLTTEEENG